MEQLFLVSHQVVSSSIGMPNTLGLNHHLHHDDTHFFAAIDSI